MTAPARGAPLSRARLRLPVLYPITDRRLAGGRSHAVIVRLLAEGGATLVQVREKEMSDRDLAAAVKECVAVSGVRIIVNDRPDVALVAGAAGAHLGEDDLPAPVARAILGRRAVIGVSTHTVADAVGACAMGVDYVALGPIFETASARVRRAPLGVGAVAEAAAAMTRPLVAIGGITLATAAEILAAGAASVAVISDLLGAADIPARVEAYLRLARKKR
jgi:thiamine-phosphate pyrophosphorylase